MIFLGGDGGSGFFSLFTSAFIATLQCVISFVYLFYVFLLFAFLLPGFRPLFKVACVQILPLHYF